jgi:hypothetical protein
LSVFIICLLAGKGKGKAKAKAPVIRGANGRIKRKCSTKPVKYTVDSEEEESEYNDSDEVCTRYKLYTSIKHFYHTASITFGKHAAAVLLSKCT